MTFETRRHQKNVKMKKTTSKNEKCNTMDWHHKNKLITKDKNMNDMNKQKIQSYRMCNSL